MGNVSLNSFQRAFIAPNDITGAVGNYKNSDTTKIAKIVVGILTLGIGYGVMRLIEQYAFVKPKIHEFCDNARCIFHALDAMENIDEKEIEVALPKFGEITLSQVDEGVFFEDGKGNRVLCKGESFQSIKEKLILDSKENPGYYQEVLRSPKQEVVAYILKERNSMTTQDLERALIVDAHRRNYTIGKDCIFKAGDGIEDKIKIDAVKIFWDSCANEYQQRMLGMLASQIGLLEMINWDATYDPAFKTIGTGPQNIALVKHGDDIDVSIDYKHSVAEDCREEAKNVGMAQHIEICASFVIGKEHTQCISYQSKAIHF